MALIAPRTGRADAVNLKTREIDDSIATRPVTWIFSMVGSLFMTAKVGRDPGTQSESGLGESDFGAPDVANSVCFLLRANGGKIRFETAARGPKY